MGEPKYISVYSHVLLQAAIEQVAPLRLTLVTSLHEFAQLVGPRGEGIATDTEWDTVYCHMNNFSAPLYVVHPDEVN